METGSPSRMPANTTRKKGTRSGACRGFGCHPTPDLGCPAARVPGWLRRSAHSRSLAYRLSSAASIGLNPPSTASWEGRHDDRPSNDASNCHRRRRTNVWRGITSPAAGVMRLRSDRQRDAILCPPPIWRDPLRGQRLPVFHRPLAARVSSVSWLQGRYRRIFFNGCSIFRDARAVVAACGRRARFLSDQFRGLVVPIPSGC